MGLMGTARLMARLLTPQLCAARARLAFRLKGICSTAIRSISSTRLALVSSLGRRATMSAICESCSLDNSRGRNIGLHEGLKQPPDLLRHPDAGTLDAKDLSLFAVLLLTATLRIIMPLVVNLQAFESRLKRFCRSLVRSVCIAPR